MRAIRRFLVGVVAVLLGSCATPPVRHGNDVPQEQSKTLLRLSDVGRSGPAIALVAADGRALKLRTVTAESVVAGPLAFTQLKLVFVNPMPRTIEGRFRIALPQGASVSRFAMKIAGQWQEAEMLEKAKARAIYEDFLHQRVDPALLEQGVGNAFGARVFPIPAKADKELIISYSQPIAGPEPALVPLAGLGELDELTVDIRSAGSSGPHEKIVKTAYTPDGDFVLDPELVSADGLRNGDRVFARVTPMSNAKRDRLGRAAFLLDTSASRALDLGRQIRMLRSWLRFMGGTRVLVAAFDQTVSVIHDGPASGFGAEHVDRLLRRRAMGASSLQHALRWVGRAAKQRKLRRVVLLGDGVVTAGGEGKALLRTVADMRRRGIERLDAVAFGGIRDDDGMRAIVTAGLERDGALIDSARGATDAWRRLNLATRSGVKVEVAGASWWWPRTLDGVQPGDEVFVYAELPASKPVRIRIDGEAAGELDIAEAAAPLVERAWARGKIASLLDRERRDGKSLAVRNRIVKLSTEHRVMSPYTSLLVLETEADYARYNLDRDALADILEIQGGKLGVVQRGEPPAPDPELAQATPQNEASGNMWGDSVGEAFGAGGLALSGVGEGGGGTGEGVGLGSAGRLGEGDLFSPPPPPSSGQGQGFGAGHGRLGRTHRARPPRIRMGKTMVMGRLPPEIIQRIVRANHGRLRGCYQTARLKQPDLEGRVTIKFIIRSDGTVGTAQVSSRTVPAALGVCVRDAFKRMHFPKPAHGIITVSYPVVFSPDGATAPRPVPISPNRAQRRRIPDPPAANGTPATATPHSGRFAEVMRRLRGGKPESALSEARRWQRKQPGDVLALVALGRSYEALARPAAAARAYGSIIDLFPSRTDLRRFAGEMLDGVDGRLARRLAIDNYQRAKAQRPDHPTGHRLLAYALLRDGQLEAAFEALEEGLAACKGPYVHAGSVLRRDLGLVGAAWRRAAPKAEALIEGRLVMARATLATTPSTQLVLNWETDSNDVDLHVYDAEGGHAYYEFRRLASGGLLHRDVTTGFGPELFTIDGDRGASGYRFQVHYYARGPMGYGMGKLHIVEHDGKGKLRLESRPFVVMRDKAFADLGTLGKWRPHTGTMSKAP